MTVLLPAAVALLSAWLTRYLVRPDARLRILDHPNPRSLHSQPVPRTGGLAISAAIILGVTVLGWRYATPALAWLGGGALLVGVISFLDDRAPVHPVYRLATHVLAAVLLVIAGFALREVGFPGLTWGWPAGVDLVVSVLFVVWMINLYNFMDGMDGLAAGMAVSGFGGMAILGWQGGDPVFAAASLTVVAAAGGFLWFNFPPARIFMGDTGSAVLGFLAAGFSLWGVRNQLFPFWASLLLFSPFVVDATVTLARRMLRGEPVWKPHRTHFYQRLVQLGWGHRRTLLAELLLFVACLASVLWAVRRDPVVQWAVLGIWIFTYGALMGLITRLEARGGVRTVGP